MQYSKIMHNYDFLLHIDALSGYILGSVRRNQSCSLLIKT